MWKHTILAVALAALSVAGAPAADAWTSLITDNDLQQWDSAGSASIVAKGGTLTVEGAGQIVYAGETPLDLKDFELQAEVKTSPGGRAGIAFHMTPGNARSHGGIEVRLDNSFSVPAGQSPLKTGSLVWLRPVVRSVAADGTWFPLQIIVRGKRVQVRIDDQLVNDYVEPANWESAPRFKSGTIGIRGHGGSGGVQIRKLQVRPLPAGPAGDKLKMDATDLRLSKLREQGFPVIDYHTHLKGGLTLDGVLARTWRSGIGAGVAVNGGKGFPITDDKAALATLRTLRTRPVYAGLQAEGREWTTLFSPATIARFDYVLTDAMTLTDHRGKRARLWIKDEVDVPDPEAFMELLVKTIEKILDEEPIDIYANPTYLPAVIARDYDRLWTPARVTRVVDALARNGVALEISNSLRLPGPAMIKQAKAKGIKFTFGSNNTDAKLGRLDYGLRMIEECALTPEDLWAPKPDGKKPIQVRAKK